MTSRKSLAIILALLALVGLLAACNFRRSLSPQELASTAAAQTVSAQLTQIALATPTLPSTNTPVPLPATNTPTPPPPPPTSPPATATPGCTDSSQWVDDITIPDNAPMDPGESFTKTWRMRNNGTCSWTSSYDLVFVDGNAMGGAAAVPLAGNVAPNSTVDISISLTAPSSNGTFRGSYRMRNDKDVLFGNTIWVQIVVGPTPEPTSSAYRTGKLTVNNSYMADLDAGTIDSGSGADFWNHAVSSSERYLEPQNGAKFKKMSGTPDFEDCKSASLSSSQISFADFGSGSWLCYKTTGGRYGRMQVDAVDSGSIKVDFRTWNK